jgi:topoisomerase-4 subunit B
VAFGMEEDLNILDNTDLQIIKEEP